MAVKGGSFQSNNNSASVNEGYGIRVDWEQIDNSYKVKASVYLELRETWSDLRLTNDREGTLSINGSTSNLSLKASNYGPAKTDLFLGSNTVDIGSAKSFTISADFQIQWNLRGENVTSFQASRQISTDSIMEAPNAPTGLSLTNPSGTSLNFSWSHSTSSLRPVDNFEVQRSVNSGSWTSVTTTTSKSVTGSGSRGSRYKYRVRARNAAGNSIWVESNAVTIPYLAPNTPSLSSGQSGTTANLSWTITTSSDRPIDNFRIERTVNGGSWSLLTSPASGSRSYSNSGLTRGSTYKYRMRAEGPGGNSSYSGTVTERIPYLAPNKPSSVSVSRSAHNRFVLTWGQSVSSDRPVDSFDVYRSVNGGSFSKVANVGGSSRSYNDDTVELGKTYQYYVVAKNVDHTTQSDNSNALTNPAGVPVSNGSSWNIHPVYEFDGANWVHRPVYLYNGSTWHWRG
ncbi:fibronectin type III domain-containing protein [Bacillus spizizenii]|nr:fibronectin type III domain-containing protein [Bacillus spizizenii]